MRIFIDADACPVKEETLKVASRYKLETFIVSNGGMRPNPDPLVHVIVVADGADVADDWIVEKAEAGDIAITADIPLAARLLDKQVMPLGPTGKPFTEQTIGMALAVREIKQHQREATQTQTRNAGFTPRDRSNFLQALDRLVQQNKHSNQSGN